MLSMRNQLAALVSIFLPILSGCSHLATHPGLAGQELPPLVPVHSYVANLDSSGAHQISPDGRRLAWIARAGLGPGVFVKDLDSGEEHLAYKGLASPTWAEDSKTLLLVAGHAGDENYHVYQLDGTRSGDRPKDLTPFAGSNSYIQSLVAGSADLLIASNKRDPKVFDLYYFHHDSGELTLLAENPGDVFYWATDRAGHLFGRVRRDGENFAFERRQPGSPDAWVPRFSWSFLDTVLPLEVGPDGTTAWVLSNRGRDKLALVRLDLDDGRESVVFDDDRVDVSGALISRKSFQPLMAWYVPEYQEHRFFDDRLRDGIASLLTGPGAHFTPTGLSRDESVVVGVVTTGQGGRTVLYDIANRKLSVLGQSTRSLIHRLSPLPEQRPVAFTSRDGLRLQGYLTLPSRTATGRLPTVLLVHGGPWHRDVWGASREADFLANRGYAVLQVNFRGSTGYGRAFRDKAIGEFAAKMHDDVVDALDWLVAQGIADPARAAIVGASYGGYEALVGVTFTPEKFACAVDFVGPSDLARLMETMPPYWESGRPFWYRFTGDPANPAQRAVMDAKSPVYRAKAVTKPVLILHGVNDPRVRIEHSERMVAALRDAGKPVDYVVFQGDGHGNQKWSNNLTFYRRMEDFLRDCLGGRSGGFDYYELAAWAF